MPIWSGDAEVSIRQAAERLAAGALVAFPTETVYGLGARADDDTAVAAVYAAKGRPSDHPLIVHVAGRAEAAHFGDCSSAAAAALSARFWPGPLTLIVPRRPGIGAVAAGGHATIGLRVPEHPVAQALLREAAALGVAGVAAPSANRFGRVSPTQARHVEAEFGPDLVVLDGGACTVGIESAIVDCTRVPAALLRPGALDRTAIERCLGAALRDPGDGAAPRAPGTLAAHYAPRAVVRLMDGAMLRTALSVLDGGTAPKGLAVYSRTVGRAPPGILLKPMPATAAEAAHELFAALREFDDRGMRLIWVEAPPAEPAWDGVRDRLQRAAAAA